MKGMHRHRSRWSGRIGIVVLLLASLLPVLSAQSVGAAAIIVDSLGDGAAVSTHCIAGHTAGTCRLRDALATAGSGGTITFAVHGTINVNQAQGPLTLAVNVTIQGPRATILTIDGGCATCGAGGTPNGGVTVFQINNGVTNAAISGLTIKHGNASVVASVGFSNRLVGGGIANFGTLAMTDSIITANTSTDYGGGIANLGTLMMTRGTISGNATVGEKTFLGSSGGIFNNRGATLQMMSSTVSGNTSSDIGGGLENDGTATIMNSIFSGNSASTGGGLIGAGILLVANSVFSGNSAGEGGGFYISGGKVNVTNSTFSNNSAAGDGGAISAVDLGVTVTAANSTFAGNTATGRGGVIYNESAAVTVINSTLTGNAAGQGGGVYNDNNDPTFVSMLSIGNTIAALNRDLATADIVNITPSTVTDRGHNLIGNPGALTFNQPGDITGQNPLLGMLADNGGTAATVLPDGSHAPTLGITTSSPAFNHGDPAICTAPLPPTGTGAGSIDERGFPRGNGTIGNPTCSIGAFEVYVVKPNPIPTPRPGGVVQGEQPKPLPVVRPGGAVQGDHPAPVPVPRR